jgi:hypothetical protein
MKHLIIALLLGLVVSIPQAAAQSCGYEDEQSCEKYCDTVIVMNPDGTRGEEQECGQNCTTVRVPKQCDDEDDIGNSDPSDRTEYQGHEESTYADGDEYYKDYFEGEGDIDDCFDTSPDDHSNSGLADVCELLGLCEGDWR